MFLQTVQSLVFKNNKNLVCRSLKEEPVAVLLQCGFYRGRAVKGGFSDMKVQIIREKGIKLDPQNAAFREKRAVLFYDRKR